MEKYYVPTIDEFRTGFEYEYMGYMDLKPYWHKDKIEDTLDLRDMMDELVEDEALDRVRVKYLDRSDIESFGFTVTKEPYRWQFRLRHYELITMPYTSKEDVPHDTIIIRDGIDDAMIFYGTIKNRTELYYLLVQLGIIDKRAE